MSASGEVLEELLSDLRYRLGRRTRGISESEPALADDVNRVLRLIESLPEAEVSPEHRWILRTLGYALTLLKSVNWADLARYRGVQVESFAAEAVLLTAFGEFDCKTYFDRLHLKSHVKLHPVLHYLLGGERMKFRPNCLFRAELYKIELEERGIGIEKSGFLSYFGHYLACGVAERIVPNYLVDREYCLKLGGRNENDLGDPMLVYLVSRKSKMCSPHPLFDSDYYCERVGDAVEIENPISHYLDVGWAKGIDPHPLFDRSQYHVAPSELPGGCRDEFRHFLRVGDAQGKRPHTLFDPNFYRDRSTERIPAGLTSLAHYVQRGAESRARTHPLFDSGYYFDRNGHAHTKQRCALEHYVAIGHKSACDPHPAFNSTLLASLCPELFGQDRSALELYLRSPRRLSVSPCDLFDVSYYCSRAKEATIDLDGPLADYLKSGWAVGRDPHPLFCTEYYIRCLKVSGIAIDSATSPVEHYLNSDIATRVSPHPLFDAHFYSLKYPDVRRSGIDPLVHYARFGGRPEEMRSPHPLFNPAFYASQIAVRLPAESNLLVHFLTSDDPPHPHPLFDAHAYECDRVSDPIQQSPSLLDYVLKGRAAPRRPHILFDSKYYANCIKVPADWNRTLLEHYCMTPSSQTFFPHPAGDSRFVLEQLGGTSERTLMEEYIARAHLQNVDAHPLFDGRSFLIRNPDLDCLGIDPLICYLRSNHKPFWSNSCSRPFLAERAGERLQGFRKQSRESGQSLKRGIESFGPFDRQQIVLQGMELSDCRHELLAFYAIHSNGGAVLPAHVQTLTELKRRGFFNVVINSSLAQKEQIHRLLEGLAEVVIFRPEGGRDFASWVLASLILYRALMSSKVVLFMNDSLIGPFASMDAIWRSLFGSRSPWWALTESHEIRPHAQTAMFALKSDALQSGTFAKFLESYRFPVARSDVIREGELELSAKLEGAGLMLSSFVTHQTALETWNSSIASSRQWMKTLPEKLSERHLARLMDVETAARVAKYADEWYERTCASGAQQSANMTLLLGELLPERLQLPFVKREFALINPLKSPGVLRLRDSVGGGWNALSKQLRPLMLTYPEDIRPILRISDRYIG